MSSAHAKYTVISLDKQYRINCAEVAIENVNMVNATTRGCHAKPEYIVDAATTSPTCDHVIHQSILTSPARGPHSLFANG